MKRYSKEQYRKWGTKGGSPLLLAERAGKRITINGKLYKPKSK